MVRVKVDPMQQHTLLSTVQVHSAVYLLYRYNIVLKVPYYTVFHQFDTAVRGPTTMYSICIAPSVVLNFSCLKVALQSSIQSSLFLCLHV